MNFTNVNPIDPYQSVVVLASAGSGKTYQLSRRFLSLVLSGAAPKSLLTVTFTKKATQEMRHRIISDALKLGTDKEFSRQLVAELETLRMEAIQQGARPPKLRSPEDASQEILNSTQSLQITTIDALFLQWCFEFQDHLVDKEDLIPVPWTPIDSGEINELRRAAWRQFLKSHDRSLVTRSRQSFREFGARSLKLYDLEGFLWLQKHRMSPSGDAAYDGSVPILEFDLTSSSNKKTIHELIEKHQHVLSEIVAAISNKTKKEIASRAIKECDWRLLQEAEIFKADGTIHRRTVSKKVIDAVGASNLWPAEEEFQSFITDQKITQLNQAGRELYASWALQMKLMKKIFAQQKKGSFLDALQSCFLNLNDPSSTMTWFTSGRYRHILLDEYQDTSILQWKVIEPLCVELLSGNPSHDHQSQEPQQSINDAALTPTVFIVGDPKQSIYGFREAEPKIFEYTASDLQDFDVSMSTLSSSWRSTRLMMSFVNEVFEKHLSLEHFETHQSAIDADDEAPRLSSIHLLLSKPEDSSLLSPQETEAAALAEQISNCFDQKSSIKVFDKLTKKYRTATPSDVAVLYASSTHTHHLEKELEKRQIPFRREGRKGFFAQQTVSDILSLLKCLVYPEDTVSLLAWLRSPLGLGEADFFDFLKSDNKRSDPSIKELHESRLGKYSSLTLLSMLRESRPELSNKYQKYREALLQSDAPSAIANLFMGWKIEETLGRSPAERSLISTLLYFLLDLAQSKSLDLATFMQSVRDAEKLDEMTFNDASAEHVKLMTIHKSKGLEFPIVFLADLGRTWTRSDPYWVKSDEGLYYVGTSQERPPHQQISNVMQSSLESQYHEKIRLLYVAITRAKEHLFLSGSLTHQPSGGLPSETLSLNRDDSEPLNGSKDFKVPPRQEATHDAGDRFIDRVVDRLKAPFLPTLMLAFESLAQSRANVSHCLQTSSKESLGYETTSLFTRPIRLETMPELTVTPEPEVFLSPAVSYRSTLPVNILGPNKAQNKTGASISFASRPLLDEGPRTVMPVLGFELPKQVIGTGIHSVVDLLVAKPALHRSTTVNDNFVSSIVRELSKLAQNDAPSMGSLVENIPIDRLRQYAFSLQDFILASSCWAKIQKNSLWAKSEYPLWECFMDDKNSRQASLHKIDLLVCKSDDRGQDHEYWIVDLKTGHPGVFNSVDDYIQKQGYDQQLLRYQKAFMGTFEKLVPPIRMFIWMIEIDQLFELTVQD